MARTGASPRVLLWLLFFLLLPAAPASAWTLETQRSIALQAARLAPPDFYRQILKHQRTFLEGVEAPYNYGDVSYHEKNPDGSGRLDEVIRQEVERTIAQIWNHEPFRLIVYQAGVVSHYLADANFPLNTAATDRYENRYFADYALYVESAEPRLQVVFYGIDQLLDGPETLTPFVNRTFERARLLYPLVGQEYRRIGQLPGRAHFDDRSTAFGVGAVAYSRAISDAALVLRYIWIQAGGADERPTPVADEGPLLLVPPFEEPSR